MGGQQGRDRCLSRASRCFRSLERMSVPGSSVRDAHFASFHDGKTGSGDAEGLALSGPAS